jgi:uncharacterized protein
MDVYQTHGAFSWQELTTPDPEAAMRFYGPLFGWTAEAKPMGGDPYHVISLGGEQVGGIMKPPAGAPMPPNWGCYVTVKDIQATVAQVPGLGGKVIMPPFAIPQVGTMAVICDPQGAVFSAIQYGS